MMTGLVLASCSGEKTAEENAAEKVEVAKAGTEVDCPSSVSIPPTPAGKPADSVGGLRVGVPLDQAILFVQCNKDDKKFWVEDLDGVGFSFQVSGDEAPRQVVRLVNGERRDVDMMENLERRREGRRQTNVDYSNITDDYYLLGLGTKGKEIVRGIWRTQNFQEGKLPAAAETAKSLIAKFGQPSKLVENKERAWLWWVYEPGGLKMDEANPSFENCSTVSPAEFDRFSASPACGLVISAKIDKSSSNELLVEHLHLSVSDSAAMNSSIETLTRYYENATAQRKLNEAQKAGADAPKPEL
jgi:hypothetical protein